MPDEPTPSVVVTQDSADPEPTVEVPVTPPVPPATPTPAEDQLATKIREDFERLYGGRIKELQNGFQAIQRHNTKLQQELEQVKATTPKPATPTPADPWATIENGAAWRATIEQIAAQKAQELFQQRLNEASAQATAQQQETIRDTCKQQVVSKYPDLGPEGDATSAVSLAFNEVLNEHPEYLKNPFGPRLAMYDMEAKLQEAGKFPTATGALPTQEIVRRARVTASAPAARTAVGDPKSVTLTKDEMEFCKYNSIDPVTFAKNKQAMETIGSLEVA